MAPAQFTAGWLYGLSGQDKRDTILSCYKPSARLTNKLYDAMDAFIAGDNQEGLKLYNDTKPLFEEALSGCKRYGRHAWVENIKEMEEREDWPQLRAEIYKENKFEIDNMIDLDLREWASGLPFNSGMFVGKVLRIFYNNMPADSLSSAGPVSPVPVRDQSAPAHFIAGWLNGLTGDDLKDHIYTCYRPDKELTDTLYDAMEAYVAHDLKVGDELMSTIEPLYEKAVAGCPKEK